MSFYVSRNYTPVVFICSALLASGSYYLVNKTQTEKRERAEQGREQGRERVEQRKKYLAEKAAKSAALEAQKQAEIEAKAQAEADRKRLAQELVDKLEAERLFMEKKQAERELAWKRFIGTKYPSLKVAGKSHKGVTILTASFDGVAFSFEYGAKKYPYKDFPIEIQEICMYDPEFTASYLAMKEKERPSKPSKKKQKPTSSTKQSNTSRKTAPPKYSSTLDKKPVIPRGSIAAKITSTKSGDSYTLYRGRKKYGYHFKTIQVTARANVPAKLYNNGSFIGSVTAGQSMQFKTQSDHKGKYLIQLKSATGKILDSEAHNRKTGLGGSTGL